MEKIAKHIIFRGHVQGVGFRFTAHHIASGCRLTGFVRNLPDGTVEMLAQGTPDDVDDCISRIQESFSAYIRQTLVDETPPDPKYKEFKITF